MIAKAGDGANCGIGAGGFQPGNNCAAGDGTGGAKQPRAPRVRAAAKDKARAAAAKKKEAAKKAREKKQAAAKKAREKKRAAAKKEREKVKAKKAREKKKAAALKEREKKKKDAAKKREAAAAAKKEERAGKRVAEKKERAAVKPKPKEPAKQPQEPKQTKPKETKQPEKGGTGIDNATTAKIREDKALQGHVDNVLSENKRLSEQHAPKLESLRKERIEASEQSSKLDSDAAFAHFASQDKKLPPERQAEYAKKSQELKAQRDEWRKKGDAAQAEEVRIDREIKDAVISKLHVDNPIGEKELAVTRVEKAFAVGMPDSDIDKTTSMAKQASDTLRPLIAKGDTALPEVTVAPQKGRASAVTQSATIKMDPTDNLDTHVHEIGHIIEMRTPGAKEAVYDFLEARVGDEKKKSMKEVNPSGDYYDYEMGRKDNFDKTFDGDMSRAYYAGKDYGGRGKATEVLSLGVELLYSDPAGFAKRDPEYFKLVVGVLNGTLRKKA